MRVFNDEVSECRNCDYYVDDKYCQYNAEFIFIEDEYIIHKDYPFSKPITKEVIEGFCRTIAEDFHVKFKLTYSSEDEDVYQTYWIEEEIFLDEEIIRVNDKYGHIEICQKWHRLSKGKLNNPEELKFILKTLEII